ncbi:MAG: hypothetical protein RL685_5151 [Pseudomonadota bacterium]
MSAGLVRRWRRVARQWRDCANARLDAPRADGGLAAERELAYAIVFTECADSLEWSLKIQARKKARAK